MEATPQARPTAGTADVRVTPRTRVKRLPKRAAYDRASIDAILDSAEGIPLCVTVTHIDGLVLARSAFHHSVNYRSVVILGIATLVIDDETKLAAMRRLIEHVAPGRWDHVRQPNSKELAATSVLSIPIVEASAKIRTGPAIDDETDYALPIWAGEIPLAISAGAPIADPRVQRTVPIPAHVTGYRLPGARAREGS